jgi:hypothetical protein
MPKDGGFGGFGIGVFEGGSAWVQAAETQGAGSVRAHTVIGKVQMGRVRLVSVLDQAATRLVFPFAPMSV